MIARFDIGLEPIDLSVQRLHIALQSAIRSVGTGISLGAIKAGVRILIIACILGAVLRIVVERITPPLAISIGIASRVSIIRIEAAPSVDAAIEEAISYSDPI